MLLGWVPLGIRGEAKAIATASAAQADLVPIINNASADLCAGIAGAESIRKSF